MTATLPAEVQEVFARFLTTEYTTVDGRGRPITWPVVPYYSPGAATIDVTTGVGYPKKADDARANPKVGLLFSAPTGSGLSDPPSVLVQGMAEVDDRDLAANRERYAHEFPRKVPAAGEIRPRRPLARLFDWYLYRIYVHIRPERVFVWPAGRFDLEPRLFDAQLEEVRSGHDEVPAVTHDPPEGGRPAWDPRLDELGRRFPDAVLSVVAPDGFPFSARVAVTSDREARRVRIGAAPVGMPLEPGLACLVAHEHDPTLRWMRNFQVRGDLVRDGGEWALVPHRVVGGLEHRRSRVARLRRNLATVPRLMRTARRELERRRAS